MSVNPYQTPIEPPPAVPQQVPEQAAGPTGLIIVLCVMVVVHGILALLSALAGLLMGTGIVVWTGGFVSLIFYVAIFFGLWAKHEWARVNLIWLCYVSIVVYVILVASIPFVAIPLIAFEVTTLIIAHNHRVKAATRGHSLAKAYVYSESNS